VVFDKGDGVQRRNSGEPGMVEIGLKFLWFCEEYFWWNGEGISIMFEYNGSLVLRWCYGDIYHKTLRSDKGLR